MFFIQYDNADVINEMHNVTLEHFTQTEVSSMGKENSKTRLNKKYIIYVYLLNH